MKKVYSLFAAILLAATVFAQAPEKIGYQAVIRDNTGNLINNQTVGMQVSILKDSVAGTAVYTETHTPTTNANGLVSLEVGSGSIVSGNFAIIDWGGGTYFIKTETEPSGGTNYTITGTSQLLSVPYALHAKTASSIDTRNLGGYFYLGQDTLGGIVFHVYIGEDGKQHGLIVSKSEEYFLSWQRTDTSLFATYANNPWNGQSNTAKMTNSPIKEFLDSLGQGWYLPSINELNLLYDARYHVNQALDKANLDMIGLKNYNMYSSSSEAGSMTVYIMDFNNGNVRTDNKGSYNFIRFIKVF